MIINHNMNAMNAHRMMTGNTAAAGKSMEKLSSGLRINRAGDDAAGLAISEKMRGQIRGLDQASRNASDGISLIQTAEGALNETHSILQRMRELAVQASSDTNVAVDRNEIQKEMNQLTSEINRIGNTTEFNTQKLINGSKRNTYTETNNNSVAVTSAGGTGLAVALSSATSALPAGVVTGANTLDITVERVDRTGVVTFNHTSGISGTLATKATFTGDITINRTAASTYHSADADNVTWTVTVGTAAGTVKVQSTTTGAETVSNDVLNLNPDGSFTYNEHGVNFTISNFGGAVAGDSLTFTVNSGSGNTVDTTKPTATLTKTITSTVTVGTSGVTADVGALAGTYSIERNSATAGNTFKITVTDMYGAQSVLDNNITSAQLNAGFSTHGINVDLDFSNTGAGTFKYEFTVADTYDLKASLNGSTASVTLMSGYDGSSATAQTLTYAGLNITNTGAIKSGQVKFNATESVVKTGTDGSLNFQIGANQGQALNLEISDMRSSALNISSTSGGTLSFTVGTATETINLTTTQGVTDGTNATGTEYALDVSSYTNATKAVTVLNQAIEKVSAERSKLGANQNRLEHTIANLGTSSENLTAAESRVRDVDMAKEMMNFSKNNILSQAAQAMLAQANQQPQGVLQLLR